MRRGASRSSQQRKPVVMADLGDLEGGGSAVYGGSNPNSGNSFHSAPKFEAPGGAVSALYDSDKAKRRCGHRRGYQSLLVDVTGSMSSSLLQQCLGLLVAVVVVGAIALPLQMKIMWLVYGAVAFGALVSIWLSKNVLMCDDGTPEMRAVSDPIREGAEGFLRVQYTAIARYAIPLALLIVVSYQFRPATQDPSGVALLGNSLLGIVAAVGFVVGALCSALSGYVSMWVAARSNIRVASAARRSYGEALVVCFRGGAFSAVLNLTLCVAGVTTFCIFLNCTFTTTTALTSMDLPMLLVGYGFGASFVALFMQLGGGIYTKAADVGADLVGKVEQSIPEDDPRNPAVIADLVGDMVGDCVGSSADVFESVAAEIIGAMILGSTLATEADLSSDVGTKFVLFPLLVHAMDIVVSSIGVAVVGRGAYGGDTSDPMVQLQKGYRVALGLSVVGFYFITAWLLDDPESPGSSLKFFWCGVVGMVCAYIIVLSTQYYTDYKYGPVQSIAEASTTGHGTNIIVGISVGMKATFVPTITVACAVLAAYHLGASTGIGDGRNAGLFGTAVATMGMLSNAVYILSMNNYGPIADNAGGIAGESCRHDYC